MTGLQLARGLRSASRSPYRLAAHRKTPFSSTGFIFYFLWGLDFRLQGTKLQFQQMVVI